MLLMVVVMEIVVVVVVREMDDVGVERVVL